jgi:Ssp1 endopeptidase immunity protein Rap1a
MWASKWISYMAVAGLAMRLGCASANAANANEVLPACQLYLSVIDRHGSVTQSELSHLMDAGECLGAVYAMLAVSHTLAEPLKFCPPVEFEAEQGVRVVVAYIEKKPERGREDFTTVALEALRSKWPCP